MERVWDRFLTDRDKRVFEKGGFGQGSGFRDRPALLVIDINYNFVGDRPEDILESVRRFRSSCGEEGWQAMYKLGPVLQAARNKKIPIIYSTSDPEHTFLDQHSWGTKNNRVGKRHPEVTVDGNAIPDLIALQPNEVLIQKKKPSVFFGTPLLQYLISLGVNQLLCCGTVTSGCVRATVVDGFSYNYRVAVIEDCTFDRGQASHAINLYDMQQKYADVIPSEQVIQYINHLPQNLFPDWEEHEASAI